MKARHIIGALAFILAGCQSSGPVPIGPDTYMLSSAGGFFTFSGGSVSAELFQEASRFCQSQGKQVMPVQVRSENSGYARPAQSDIQFRCLAANDPDLKRPNLQPTPNVVIERR